MLPSSRFFVVRFRFFLFVSLLSILTLGVATFGQPVAVSDI